MKWVKLAIPLLIAVAFGFVLFLAFGLFRQLAVGGAMLFSDMGNEVFVDADAPFDIPDLTPEPVLSEDPLIAQFGAAAYEKVYPLRDAPYTPEDNIVFEREPEESQVEIAVEKLPEEMEALSEEELARIMDDRADPTPVP